MIPASIALVVAWWITPLASATQPEPGTVTDEPAFLELTVDRAQVSVHEPFTVRVEFGFEEGFFAEQFVPLFTRRLDLSVQLVAPWLEEFAGTELLPASALAQPTTIAVNGGVEQATRGAVADRDGSSYSTFAFEREFVATAAGDLEVAAVTLNYAYATQFQDDLLRGRVALDRQSGQLQTSSARVVVTDLPTEGRPESFTGAVGQFAVRADALSRKVEVGESFTVVVTIEGEGQLDRFSPPAISELDGFHVYGKLESAGAGNRTLTYDVAVVSEAVTQLPPLEFSFYDPSPGGYRTIATEAIPLQVSAVTDAVGEPSTDAVSSSDEGDGSAGATDPKDAASPGGPTTTAEPTSDPNADPPTSASSSNVSGSAAEPGTEEPSGVRPRRRALQFLLFAVLLSVVVIAARRRRLRASAPAAGNARASLGQSTGTTVSSSRTRPSSRKSPSTAPRTSLAQWRTPAPSDPRAIERWRQVVASGGEGSAGLMDYLGGRLGVAPAAAVGSKLVDRLTAAGIAADLAERASVALENLLADRYGGSGQSPSPEELRSLVDQLEAAFAKN